MKPADFTIAIDTREQLPLEFAGYQTQRGTLPTGDYSIVGYESQVAIERKSHADGWAAVAAERARFERCLGRLAKLDRAAIVIECSLAEFCERPTRVQRVTPATAVGSFISWSCQYRIPVFFAGSRAFAERVVVRFLASWMKHRAPTARSTEVVR